MIKKIVILGILTIMSSACLIGCANTSKNKTTEVTEEALSDNTEENIGNEELDIVDNEVENTNSNYEEKIINSLGKTIDELDILDDNPTNLGYMLTDEETSWVFPFSKVSEGLAGDEYDSFGYFVNKHNTWKSEHEVPLTYVLLSEETFLDDFLGIDSTELDISNFRDILNDRLGEPVKIFGDNEIIVYDYKNIYIVLNLVMGDFQYYVVDKNDLSILINADRAKELGQEDAWDEGYFSGNGAANRNINIDPENGELKLQMCNRLFTLTDFDGYEVNVSGFVLTDGIYQVPSFELDKKDSTSDRVAFSLEENTDFTEYITPFYNTLTSNKDKFTVLDEGDNYVIYKINPSMVWGETSEVSVYLKDFDITVTLLYGSYDNTDEECITDCKEIVEYFSSSVTVEIIE